MVTVRTSTKAPTTHRSSTMTSDVDRLRDLIVGPEGLRPEQFDALVAGWDPAEAPLVQFLIARGFLDRIGAQTLSTVLRGYVRLRGVGLCNLFKRQPGPAAPTSRPISARSSTPSASAASAFAPRPGREAYPVAAVPVPEVVTTPVGTTPVGTMPAAATPMVVIAPTAGSESAAQEPARLCA